MRSSLQRCSFMRSSLQHQYSDAAQPIENMQGIQTQYPALQSVGLPPAKCCKSALSVVKLMKRFNGLYCKSNR